MSSDGPGGHGRRTSGTSRWSSTRPACTMAAAAALYFFLVCLTSLATSLPASGASDSDNPRLVILPDQRLIRRPVKRPLIVTCKGDNAEPSLFTELRWLDANGEEINSNYQNKKIKVTKEAERLLLSFFEPSSNDGGTYTCEGKFQVTEALKTQADISFYQDIAFEDCPESQALVKGSPSSAIRCSVSANPPPIVSWTKNGEVVSQDLQRERYIIENNGIRVKDEVNEDDAGQYHVTARVEETGAVEYRYITVEVHVLPQVLETRQDRNATEGDEVTLSCLASGVPSPMFTWFDPLQRNLSSVEGYSVDRDRGVLVIRKVKRHEDNGDFTCEASNAAGKTQREHNVEVITRPAITSFANVSAIQTKEGRLECRATGMPPPKLSIRKDGDEFPLFQGKERVTLEEHNSSDETILTVTLTRVLREDDGLYYCAAENIGGRVDRVGHLTVEFAPDLKSTNTEVKTWDAQPIKLVCEVEAIPNATVKWWFRGLEIYPDGSNPSYSISTSREGSHLLVRPHGSQGLSGGDVYGNYRCTAANIHGEGQVEIKLGQASRPEPPGPIVIKTNSATTLSFGIGYPANDGGLPVRNYVVVYREELTSDEQTVTWPATGDGPYKLENLIPRQRYMIRFAAKNDVGVGMWTQEQRYIMPYESAPEQVLITLPDSVVMPESGDLKSSNPRDFLLQWREPVNNGREIEAYKLKYYRVMRAGNGWRQVGKDRAEKLVDKNHFFYYRVYGLDPDAFYRLEVVATNAKGDSDPSYIVFKTAPGDPRSQRHIGDASSLSLIVGLILLALVVILVVMDIVFYVKHKKGALYFLRNNLCSSNSRSLDAKEKQQMDTNTNNVAGNGTEV